MKRRLQFGLGSLFLLVVAAALGLQGYLAWTAQDRAIQALKQQGSELFLIGDGPPDEGVIYPYYEAIVRERTDFSLLHHLPRFADLRIEDRELSEVNGRGLRKCLDLRDLWARRVKGAAVLLDSTRDLPGFRVLCLSESDVADADLTQLNPALVRLELRDSQISDVGLASIARLKHLRMLVLHGESLSDQGIAGLRQCTALERLTVDYPTQVTDASCEALASLPKLTHLRLHSNQLTDAGLKQLRSSPSLMRVDVRGDGISGQAFREAYHHFSEIEKKQIDHAAP